MPLTQPRLLEAAVTSPTETPSEPCGSVPDRRVPEFTAAALRRLALSIAAGTTACTLAACGGSGGTSTRGGAGAGSGTTGQSSVTTGRGSTSATSPTPTPTATTPGSTEVSAGVVRASSGAITATMQASSHHPRVNRPWPVSFAVTRAGQPVKAQVRYEYLFAGQVVAHRSHYTFTGTFHDVFHWPSSAVGYPLTLRAVVSSGSVMLNLDYPVQVSR